MMPHTARGTSVVMADRIRQAKCGCRYDVVTGITTFFCAQHAEATEAKGGAA